MTLEAQEKTSYAVRVMNDFREGKISRDEMAEIFIGLGAKTEDAMYMTLCVAESFEMAKPFRLP